MTAGEIGGVPLSAFARRRELAVEALGNGVMVLPAAAVQHASRDTERPYVPDRELYYLTGVTEPESVAVLVGGDEPETVLFVRDRDRTAELWAGARMGPEGAAERFGIGDCRPLTDLDEALPDLLQRGDRIHYRLSGGSSVEPLVLDALGTARARGPRAGTGPRGIVDPGEILDELRLRKDDHEIALLRVAAAITLAGQRAGAGLIAPGRYEWEVEAALEAAFGSAGATGPGFETIVGAGSNGCVLHYVKNDAVIAEGDLVLIDAGAEARLYHGDVTRTYPANGRFDERQRAVYDLVDAARASAITVAAPGVTIGAVHDAAVRVLTEGLIDLAVLDGDQDTLIEESAYKEFFPHQTSHWLGLDVHDPGDYARDRESRALEPGMVFTVEPGLYFRPDAEEAGAYAGIGVRIEDDVLVTEDGVEVLTSDLPTAADEVQALVGAAR